MSGLDGAYVQAKSQPSRTEGCFEVVVGKSLPTEDRSGRCFGLVSRYEPEPQGRFSAWLDEHRKSLKAVRTFIPNSSSSYEADLVKSLMRFFCRCC